MHNSSLLKILKVLSPSELKELKKFLNCTYLNKHKQCEKLFNILANYHPDFDSPKLDSEKIYKRVFGKDATYEGNESNFRTLVANLKKGVNQFLILEELNNKPEQQHLLLLDAYTKRGASASLQTEVTKKCLNEKSTISSWYFYDRFQLYWKLYNEESTDTYNAISDSFILLNKYLDYFYALTKLKLGIEQQNLHKRDILTTPITLLPAVQEFVKENSDDIPEVILLYTKLVELSQNPENGIDRLKEILSLFESQIPQLSREDSKDIITVLFNFTNSKLQQQISPETYKQLRFEVVKLSVTYGLYTDDQTMSNMQYKIVVLSAIVATKFDWAAKFMEDHQQYLVTASKIFCIQECLGIFYYFKAKALKAPDLYLKSIEAFNVPTGKNDAFNKRKIWSILIAYYEYFLLVKTEYFFTLTHNFHTVIKRCQGFSDEEKRQLLNTLNALKYMAKTRLDPNYVPSVVKKRIEKYRQEEHYRVDWITEMFDEFEQQI